MCATFLRHSVEYVWLFGYFCVWRDVVNILQFGYNEISCVTVYRQCPYIILSPTKFWPSPKLAIAILDSFIVSILTLIPPQLGPSPPPLFILNSITAILFTTTYLSVRLPTSNRFRTLLPILMLKLLNHVVSLLSYALVTGSHNWTHRIQTPLTHKVLTTTQPPYLHHLISVQSPRSTRSSSLVTLARPPTSSSLRITDHYRQHCAQRKPAGISFTQRPILRFFAPQGRHVAPMGVKFSTEEGTPSVQQQGCRTPQIEIFTQIWPKSGI